MGVLVRFLGREAFSEAKKTGEKRDFGAKNGGFEGVNCIALCNGECRIGGEGARFSGNRCMGGGRAHGTRKGYAASVSGGAANGCAVCAPTDGLLSRYGQWGMGW